nr:putative potassium transporter 12 [Ipomoea batatas]
MIATPQRLSLRQQPLEGRARHRHISSPQLWSADATHSPGLQVVVFAMAAPEGEERQRRHLESPARLCGSPRRTTARHRHQLLERAVIHACLRKKKPKPDACDSLVVPNTILSVEPNCLRVMSAVSGLQGKIPGFGTNDHVITSVVILALFSIQPFGSSKVAGFTFAPALAIWFFSLGSIGNYVC